MRASRVLPILLLLGGSLAFYLLDGRREAGPDSAAADRKDSVVDEARVPTEQKLAQVAALTLPESSQQTAEMHFWEQVERDSNQASTAEPREQAPEETGRQTRFDDYNYRPRKQVNTIKSVAVKPARTSPRSQQQGLTGTRSASIRWVNARGNTSRWKTRFDFQSGRIDNSTFCLNVGKGSIAYRECRKGAQQWLRNQCRTDRSINDEWRRMYCQAYRNYRT